MNEAGEEKYRESEFKFLPIERDKEPLRLPLLDFSRRCGDTTLQGRLTDLYPQGQFAFSVGKIYPHQKLGLWLRHLTLCLERPTDVAPRTLWLEDTELGGFRKVEEPETHLASLLNLYHQGLNTPLAFYPGTSWDYVDKLFRSGDPVAAYRAAERKWLGNEHSPGDRSKPYQQLLFADTNILDETFERISLAVFRPLVEHLETGS